jgi:predicted transcriptional regulator
VSDELLAIYYKIMNNRTARKTILILGENKHAKATELISQLNVSPGTFYDALKKLKNVVEKTSDGRYTLTDMGKKLYLLLLNESRSISTPPSQFTNFVQSFPYLFPLSLFKMINKLHPNNFILLIIGVLSLGGFGFFISKLLPFGYFVFPPYSILINIQAFYNLIIFFLNLIFIITLTYLLTYTLGEIKNSLHFILSLTLTYIPIIIFVFIYYIFHQWFYELFLNNMIYYYLIFLPILFYSYTLTISCIFENANIRIESAFIIVTFILLVTFIGVNVIDLQLRSYLIK